MKFTDEQISYICSAIADEMADWYQNENLTFSEQVFAETVEKILVIRLRANLKYDNLQFRKNL